MNNNVYLDLSLKSRSLVFIVDQYLLSFVMVPPQIEPKEG